MEMIMMSINESWVWLGPLLLVCFGIVLIAQVVDVFKSPRTSLGKEMCNEKQID